MRTLGFLRTYLSPVILPMIITVDSGDDSNFTITTSEALSPNYDINIVGVETLTGNTGTKIIDFPSANTTYTLEISGDYDGLSFSNLPYDRLLSVEQWGTNKWTSCANMFYRCSYPAFNATDEIDVSECTSFSQMFYQCYSISVDMTGWDVSNATNMNAMFYDARFTLDQDLSLWCVANIPSRPSGFDDYVGGWTLPRPVWGLCPNKHTPLFTQLGPYVIDETPDTLPTTSTNGIEGTWNDAIDTSETGTTTYTFTPTNTGTSYNATMDIVVNKAIVTLTINVGDNGSVTVNGDTYTEPIEFANGTTANIIAIPVTSGATPYKFSAWSGDISGGATTSLSMTTDKTGGVSFVEMTYIGTEEVILTKTSDGSFVIPRATGNMILEATGGGGAGGKVEESLYFAADGGGGGGYSKSTFDVEAYIGQTLSYYVGAGGTNICGSTPTAAGGSAVSIGGTWKVEAYPGSLNGSGGSGDYTGGSGGFGVPAAYSGGGGGRASDGFDGADAVGQSGYPSGRVYNASVPQHGASATMYGCGGSGGIMSNVWTDKVSEGGSGANGGSGARGQVVITYTKEIWE